MGFERNSSIPGYYDIERQREDVLKRDPEIFQRIEGLGVQIKSRVLEVFGNGGGFFRKVAGDKIKQQLQSRVEEFSLLAGQFGISEKAYPLVFADLWKVIEANDVSVIIPSSHYSFVCTLYARIINLDFLTKLMFDKFKLKLREGMAQKGVKSHDLCFLADDLWRWLNEELES